MQSKAFMLAPLPLSLRSWQDDHIKHYNIASSHGIEARLVFVTMPSPRPPSPYVCHHPTSVSINHKIFQHPYYVARQNSTPVPKSGTHWLAEQ